MPRRKCKHCGLIRADNSQRLIDHIKLLQCTVWKEKQAKDAQVRPQQVLSGGRPMVLNNPDPENPTQAKLAPSFTSKERKQKLDRLAAMAIYADARPFTTYECSAMKEFLFELDPSYNPPSADILSGRLLNEIYSETKERVDTELRATKQWNIVFDESEDISHHRIINLIICVASGAFFYS
jgi:hypothetical protein